MKTIVIIMGVYERMCCVHELTYIFSSFLCVDWFVGNRVFFGISVLHG